MDGCQTLRTRLDTEYIGFTSRFTSPSFPAPSKLGTPRKELQPLNCSALLKLQGKTASAVRISVGSDNQSNVFSLLNHASKKPRTAAVLMEFVLLLHSAGCALTPCHVPRELNQWADDLTHPLYGGFSAELYIDVSGIFKDFTLCSRLTSGLDIDLSHGPT